MRLSLVFELLLIFVLLAFAASKSIKKPKNNKKSIRNANDEKQDDTSSTINKYCKCSEAYCNCCRDFQLPVVNLDGPGCASLMYLSGDKMSVSLSFGKKVITNRTLSSRKPTPVCMPLPGGITKFCGRVYNIARAGEEFRACLGLELQSKSTVEAAVRVSCFKFGPRGVTSEAADPLPLVPQDEKGGEDDDDDDDDDDEDDFGGLVGDDDDDDEDDDDDDGLDAVNDVDSADYTGFSLLGEDLLGDLFTGSSGGKKIKNKNKNKKQAPASTTTTTTTTRRPRPSRRPSRRPTRTTTPRPITTRTTTVRVRPVNKRPTRRPTRRPENRPPRPSRRPPSSTTVEVAPVTETSATVLSTVTAPTVKIVTTGIQSTESIPMMTTEKEQAFEPVLIVTQRPMSTLADTSAKDETQFEDPGLEMSLAQLTGQLSVMPVTPILPTSAKVSSSMMTTNREQTNYEKIETITPKTSSTISMRPSSEETVNDDLVQIVHDLDSHSEEIISEKPVHPIGDSPSINGEVVPNDPNEGLRSAKKHNKGDNFDYKDLDVIGLSEIGETVGKEIGLFGKNKKHKNHHENLNNHKVKDGKKDTNDYDDILGLDALSDTLGLSGNNKQKKKKPRGRQNKMMRGDWDQV